MESLQVLLFFTSVSVFLPLVVAILKLQYIRNLRFNKYSKRTKQFIDTDRLIRRTELPPNTDEMRIYLGIETEES
ncbi:hypothetical protein T10_2252 [Trichinella papuae]|uniref:Uncharacterized protein n=1 Tax=Trichinella papuae TaxID=268474 RepID=A0A0V1MM90_9BILA|nr:hypothetical protein T10_2252 [Trichinella papuae]